MDPDLDADLHHFVDRAVAQIAVPPRSAPHVRGLSALALLRTGFALLLVTAVAVGVGQLLLGARGAVGTTSRNVTTTSPDVRPSREPANLVELPDEGAVIRALNAGGLSIHAIGGSLDEAALGPVLPARAFIVSSGPTSGGLGEGADVLFLRGRSMGLIEVCATSGSAPGRVLYSVYLNGQSTANFDAVNTVYFLVGPDYFVIARASRSRDALMRGLQLTPAQCSR